MKLIADQLRDYLDKLVPPRHAELERMEAHARQNAFPIIGPAAGQFCYQLTRLMGATRVFEMGSGYGYSTAWFARGVYENGGGIVHHVVWDRQLSEMAKGHLARLGYAKLVQYHVAEAIATLRSTPGPFDIIFNDVDKDAYPASIPLIANKLRPGGALVIDNMLWSGRIFDEDDQTASTAGIREATRLLSNSKDWLTSLVPIRDGLMIAMKR